MTPKLERGHATFRDARRAMAMPGVMARAGLWSALAFILNLMWEIAHVRLYALWATADAMTVAWSLLHCTLGDVVIALAMFALVGMVLRRVDWPILSPWTGGVIVVIGTMVFTAWSEWYNVYSVGNWAYAASMPMIFGIGLSPLLQWLILPPIMVITYRGLGSALFDRHSPQRPILTHNFTRSQK